MFRRGYEVKLMMRGTSDANVISDVPCEIYHGDISNQDEVSMAVKGCDYVVHTASITQQWAVTFKEYELINVRGTINVVNACLEHNVKKLIHISTANTIGPGNKIKLS
ncbi:NAD-dependent epimerase/dehydratase family protein [Pedobacter panaciterrae]